MEKTVQNIPFLRITIALATGILVGINFNIDPTFYLTLLAFILLLLTVFNKTYKYSYSFLFGLGIQFFFIILGIFATQLNNKKPELFEKGDFLAVVLETPQEKQNSYKSLIQVEAVYSSDSLMPTKELVIAYFAKNDSALDLQAGDIILFNSLPQSISNYNNPYEFDYKEYLERKKIFRQVYLAANNWIKTSKTKASPGIKAEQVRERLLQIYRNQPIDETEFEILSALTLGYKRELDPETKRIFSASGASHVLAVSGLHVGIVFWITTIVFGFLRTRKRGRLLFVLTSISILWCYAFITGLSPSVMRASVMFSIFVIGENLNRKSNIYNSLAASAFFLLLINPNNLFDVGFQLSYSAVFGIVFLQPKLEKLIFVKNKIFKFFWVLITVSISAQIATFPITTYYFGQFPTYFWLSNTFVIPVVMVLIPLGMLLLFVSKIHILSSILAITMNFIIKMTYLLLSLINQLPLAISEISVNRFQLIFLVAMVSSVFIYLKKKRVLFIKTALFFTLLLMLSILANDVNRLNNIEMIVYNTAKNPGIHLIQGKRNYIVTEQKLEEEEIRYYPGTFTMRYLGLDPPVFLTSTDTLKNENILIKNGLIVFEGKSFSFNKNLSDLNTCKLPDFIVNPITKNFNDIDYESCTTIITNKRFYGKNELNAKQIHYTSTKGAFRKKW